MFYLHVDKRLIAEYYDLEFARTRAETMDGWEKSIDHLPHRQHLPKRHIVLTDKHSGEVIFDNEEGKK